MQPWESDVSLGTKTIADAPAPRFPPPPPLAPIRPAAMRRADDDIHQPPPAETIPMPTLRARDGPPPLNRSISISSTKTPLAVSRFSHDSSSDASSVSDYGSGGSGGSGGSSDGGLRPPPQRRRSSWMPTIPGSPTDATETDGISPILSRAPGASASASAPPPLPPLNTNTVVLLPAASPSDDVISTEHKRVPGVIPRSPRSPLSPIRIHFGFIAKRAVRKAVPAPIVVVVQQPSPSMYGDDEDRSAGLESVNIGTPITTQTPTQTKPTKMSTRRTVWGIVDGWWDLGLLERMSTIKRKR